MGTPVTQASVAAAFRASLVAFLFISKYFRLGALVPGW
jgi:hypothetical protein